MKICTTLFPILLAILSSCGTAERLNCLINQSTASIHANREIVEMNTQMIRHNAQVINASTETIKENQHQLEAAGSNK